MGASAAAEVAILRRRVAKLEADIAFLKARTDAAKASAARARVLAKFAQLDGGREALRVAIADHDGATPWPQFLAARAVALEQAIASKAKSMHADLDRARRNREERKSDE